MAQGFANPTDKVTGQVVDENPTDAVVTGQQAFITLSKNLELRIKTDDALRGSIETLIEEIREFKTLIMMMQGVK